MPRSTTPAATQAGEGRSSLRLFLRGSWLGGIHFQVAVIHIVDAHDVVLAEIAVGLHLDDLERHLPGVFEPMENADADVERLVLAQVHDFLSARDLVRVACNEPIHGTILESSPCTPSS